MYCVSCDICVYHLGLFVFFPGVFLSSRVTGACPVTTDLIMRVNAKTTTTTRVPSPVQRSFHISKTSINRPGKQTEISRVDTALHGEKTPIPLANR